MKYLITGATGFIGKNVLLNLYIKNDIIVISRQKEPNEYKNIKNIHWIKCDLSKKEIKFKKGIKIDYVINCLGNHSSSREKELIEANETSVVNLFNSLQGNFKKFIHISSHTVYGNINKLNILENTEKSKILNPYACSKLNAENWISLFSKLYKNKHILILRYTGFIDGNCLIKHIIDKAKNNETIKLYNYGNICRDYLNTENAIAAISQSIKLSKKGLSVYNIGSGEKITTFNIAKIIVKNLKSKSKIKKISKTGYLGNFVFNISKAQRDIKFNPKKLSKIILDYIDYNI